ncbi:hypothetical protein CDL12_20081 [Handroanthus impetiginosus]|uniref:Uncharacterized protein n=1 Tax=Handroanthus impetiginosus TaxID=429701 RepID=A0A2G9GQ51_9LAMI|nr:hypothetical protein CDL12_20081 [Handroanthus impetiginosus]
MGDDDFILHHENLSFPASCASFFLLLLGGKVTIEKQFPLGMKNLSRPPVSILCRPLCKFFPIVVGQENYY